MEFMDVVAARKSVRSYNDKEVEEEKLTKILEAARLAPSWANKQCWSYGDLIVSFFLSLVFCFRFSCYSRRIIYNNFP